ncbi:MAG: integrase [Gemmatimonadetes bacterium]|nr:integrase [Gemmatimonadota bacterium]
MWPRRVGDLRELAIPPGSCWRDNIFVERLSRSLKYEEVYLHAYDAVSAATAGLSRYLTLYNTRRPHSRLDDRTPAEAYFTPQLRSCAA